MPRVKILKVLLWSSMFCIFIMSGSFLLMPIASNKALNGESWWLILSGLLFWAPLILGYTLFFIANQIRKRQRDANQLPGGIKAWGILRFFSNFWAFIADVTFLIGLIGFLVFTFINQESYGVYIFLCITVLGLNLHSVLNGVNFKFATSSNKSTPRVFNGKKRSFVYDANMKCKQEGK